jgi:hypothetical protein
MPNLNASHSLSSPLVQVRMRKSHYHLQRYESLDGSSGVTRYAVGPDYIIVEFNFTDGYRYDYSAPGQWKVEAMKKLAEAGKGLTTFINQEVRDDYAEKLW